MCPTLITNLCVSGEPQKSVFFIVVGRLRGGGGKAGLLKNFIVVGPLKEKEFVAASLN